jgi:3-hydroxybutyryl-CoA dehydratase
MSMGAAAAGATVGETFSRSATLEAANIAAFALSVGDHNPLHHDPAYAKGTRFGGIIACGPQYASMLMGLVATHYAGENASVGLEFSFRFAKPVRAGDTITLTWTVAAVDFNPRLKGDIVTLDGSITNQDGVEVLTSKGKVVVFRR